MRQTRREFGRFALAALPAGWLGASGGNAVEIGINAPYSFRGMSGAADDVLKYLTELGLHAVELRSQPIEASFGAPIPANRMGNGGPRQAAPQAGQQDAASLADALEKWRLSAPVSQFAGFRKKWNAAGVDLQIIKFDGVDKMKDEVVGYAFEVVKAMGARAMSCEIPVSKTKWLGELAAAHKTRVAYHGHGNVTNPEAFATPESWEKAMSFSKYNCINLDIGHFIAGNNTSPVPFIKKHADRITHIHLKDRKLNNGPNVPWGQGDTPVREVLQLMKKEKYPFQATIEFEYPVPEGSTVMKEIARCVTFCKEALA